MGHRDSVRGGIYVAAAGAMAGGSRREDVVVRSLYFGLFRSRNKLFRFS